MIFRLLLIFSVISLCSCNSPIDSKAATVEDESDSSGYYKEVFSDYKDPEIDSFSMTTLGQNENGIKQKFTIENGVLNLVFSREMHGCDDQVGYSRVSGDTLYIRVFSRSNIVTANVQSKQIFVRFKNYNKIPKHLKISGVYEFD